MIYSLSFEEENLFSLSIFTIYFELVNGFMLYFLAPAVTLYYMLHAMIKNCIVPSQTT